MLSGQFYHWWYLWEATTVFVRIVVCFDGDCTGELSFKLISSVVSLYCDGLGCTISKHSSYFEEWFRDVLCGIAKTL